MNNQGNPNLRVELRAQHTHEVLEYAWDHLQASDPCKHGMEGHLLDQSSSSLCRCHYYLPHAEDNSFEAWLTGTGSSPILLIK